MRILHYPRLDTILMVEKTIKELDIYPTRKELWQKLPKKVQYQTFKIIIEYLQDSNKIIIEKNKIIWIFNPNLVKQSVDIDI